MQQKQVIILIGPPGSGKGTQAILLADDFGYYHFEVSRVLEEKFKTIGQDDPVMSRAKEDFKAGKLVDSKLVIEWTKRELQEAAHTNKSVVFSSSFRTENEVGVLLPFTEGLYGKENILVVNIGVSEEVSIKRNSKRRICKANRHPIPNFPEFENITKCPKDGSEIETRILDNPETIKVRYATYLAETKPVLDYFKSRGYIIVEVNGDQAIRAVHNDIMNGIHASAHPDL